jgi:hypothetical protein
MIKSREREREREKKEEAEKLVKAIKLIRTFLLEECTLKNEVYRVSPKILDPDKFAC